MRNIKEREKMLTVLEKNNYSAKISSLISNDEPIILIKNFYEKNICKEIKEACHFFSKNTPHFLGNVLEETFFQIDVLPTKVQTNRIFRSFHFNKNNGSNVYTKVISFFDKMEEFQKNYVVPDNQIPNGFKRGYQILHYPKGGGYFDWHEHPRHPVNYGLIVNLSEKKIDFNEGQTEFKVGNDIIKIDEYADIGDLVLFRFDLEHRVAPCDPNEDLLFSSNGRWTAVLPLLNSAHY